MKVETYVLEGEIYGRISWRKKFIFHGFMAAQVKIELVVKQQTFFLIA